MIKPIETVYKGYRFRSRLEARWAVFFDEIGAEWEYEPEGFILPDGTKYLPDFRVKHIRGRGIGYGNDDSIWIEIKGKITDNDLHKIELFADANDFNGAPQNNIIIFGNLPKEVYHPAWRDTLGYHDAYYSLDFWNNDSDEFYNLSYSEGDYYWTEPKAGIGGGLVLDYPDDPYAFVDIQKTINAYRKARMARFEHGESPEVIK